MDPRAPSIMRPGRRTEGWNDRASEFCPATLHAETRKPQENRDLAPTQNQQSQQKSGVDAWGFLLQGMGTGWGIPRDASDLAVSGNARAALRRRFHRPAQLQRHADLAPVPALTWFGAPGSILRRVARFLLSGSFGRVIVQGGSQRRNGGSHAAGVEGAEAAEDDEKSSAASAYLRVLCVTSAVFQLDRENAKPPGARGAGRLGTRPAEAGSGHGREYQKLYAPLPLYE